eukprot:TRINITY_DN44386_c0_g1_i1.p1 TRINITY_DN44386_c0_g1~~TRINITY_DN44386_c0_g1_i1.p1  ORF type:complete len:220 (+),score=39.69 TRINITY_DN44386_c0_g1_i1:81-740(+)
MLQVLKNEAVTDVAQEQLCIRSRELEWCTRNYDTMALQAAMFAGFAFEQITEPVPQNTDLLLEVMYISSTTAALGLQLCVCMSCTFVCIFGKGLALRGAHGGRSVHLALDHMSKEQKFIFIQYLLGILLYLLSRSLKMWIYFRPFIALVITIPLLSFLVTIVLYVVVLVNQLLVTEDAAVLGTIAALSPYERIRDLDEEVHCPTEKIVLTGRAVFASHR